MRYPTLLEAVLLDLLAWVVIIVGVVLILHLEA